jgi:hypothetical protein
MFTHPNSGEATVKGSLFAPNGVRDSQIPPIFVAFSAEKPSSQVDISGFVCYMPALRVKGEAFAGPLLYQNSYPIN